MATQTPNQTINNPAPIASNGTAGGYNPTAGAAGGLVASPFANLGTSGDPTFSQETPIKTDVNGGTTSAGALMSRLYTMSRDELNALQTRLYKAGLLRKNSIDGVMNPQTYDAYRELLHDTHVYNVANPNEGTNDTQAHTPDSLLNERIQGQDGLVKGTSADPLLAQFNKSLGRGPTDEERQRYNASGTTADDFVHQDQAVNQDATAYRDDTKYYDAFLAAIRSSA